MMKQSAHTYVSFNEFRKRLGLNSVTFSGMTHVRIHSAFSFTVLLEFEQQEKVKQIFGNNEGDIDLFVGLLTEKQQPTHFPLPYTAGT